MKASVIPQLTALFAERLYIDVPSPETDLIEAGLLDSLQLVELLLHIEHRLGCRIPLQEVDFEDLRSVERIAGLIAARRERQDATA